MLSPDFRKHLRWFHAFFVWTNGMFSIHDEHRVPISLYVEVCTMDCRAICQYEAYHNKFHQHIIKPHHPICHLEALNAVVTVKMWAQQHKTFSAIVSLQ